MKVYWKVVNFHSKFHLSPIWRRTWIVNRRGISMILREARSDQKKNTVHGAATIFSNVLYVVHLLLAKQFAFKTFLIESLITQTVCKKPQRMLARAYILRNFISIIHTSYR